MELSPKEAAEEIIRKSKRILLVARQNPTEDSVASLLAMGLILEKLGKDIDMVCQGPIATSLSFLPEFDQIGKVVKNEPQFIISLDTTKAAVAQFSYDFDQDGNKLNIFITPERGNFEEKDLATSTKNGDYDLIVVLDSPDLEVLGGIFENNSKLFFENPILNIDHHVGNEQFGEVNLVDIKASSTAEVIYLLVENMKESDMLDENVATAILSGIIAGTKSFQDKATTPKSFTIAAQLIALGADQQKIVRHMYKNRSLASLKLWGRALSSLQFDNDRRLAWTILKPEDFEAAGAATTNLSGIEEEIGSSISEAEAILVLFKTGQNQGGYLSLKTPDQARRLAKEFPGRTEDKKIVFKLDKEENLENFAGNVLKKFERPSRPS